MPPLPRPLSHSSMSLYRECPLKYKFKYVDGIPERPRHFFSFGQSVHLAVERFYADPSGPPPLEELLRHFREIWVPAGYRDELQEADYFEQGRGILTRFHDKHSRDYMPALHIEFAFSLEVDGVPVTGRVDRIDRLPDGRLRVLDYKTGKALAASRLETDPQLTFYQLAVERSLGAEVGELVFYHLPTLKEHRSGRRAAAQIDEVRARVAETAQGILAGRFPYLPEDAKCRWCDYKPKCPAFAGAAPPPPAADKEIAALVDRYGEACARAEAARREVEASARDLAAGLAKRGAPRAQSERFEVSLSPGVRWEFLDKPRVLALLKEAGAYDRVLAPAAPLIHKLLEEPGADPGLRARLAELGERVDAPELKLRPR